MVAARETTLQELLEGSKQYQVPLYQRTYSWTKPQLARLWDDVRQLAADRTDRPGLTHFIGSLVLAPSPTNGPAGVAEYLVVDGQQRLTRCRSCCARYGIIAQRPRALSTGSASTSCC
jgi:uncharacterized protein with ParB-like and HNH nuclease domain